MKNIRQGVFETNSSSTHSICVAKDVQLELPGSVHFEFGEFGWESSRLGSVAEKASYLVTGLYGNSMESVFEEVKATLESKGITVTEELGKNKYGYDGYVDHGDRLVTFIEEVTTDEDKLLSFLFSPLSFILTGNDNEECDIDIHVTYPYHEYYKGN